MNGQSTQVQMRDTSVEADKVSNIKVTGEGEIGAPLPGRLTRVLVKAGDQVYKNTPFFVIEAMKMESTVTSALEGIVKKLFCQKDARGAG